MSWSATPWGRALLAAPGWAVLALLAGCEQGEPGQRSAAAGADAPQAAVAGEAARTLHADLPARALQRQETERHAASGQARPSTPLRWELQVLGDVERPDGLVERSYRVTLHNGSLPLPQLMAVAEPAVPGVRVQQGRLVLGDVAAGAVRSASGALTLIQAGDWMPRPEDLRWVLSADAALHDRRGALLPGLPDAPATAGLRNWHPPLPEGWRVQAVLSPHARLADANAALSQANLRIAQMRPGNHTLALVPVGSASEAGLQRSVQALSASGAFVLARLLPPASGLGPGSASAAHRAEPDPFRCDE